MSIYCRACDLPAQHLGLVDALVVLLLMPQRPAARPVNKTHFSTPARSVPYSPLPQDSSPRSDRPGPRNITLPWPASPGLAAPRHAHGFPTTSFGSFPCLGPARALCLHARKPASLHCHKLPPTVTYYLPAARAPRATTTTTLRRAHLPPAPWALHCRAVSLASIGDIRRGSLCFCDVGRHAPYLVAVGNCPPAPGPQSTTIISPSVHQAYCPPLSPSLFFLDHPAAPSPQNPRGRKEGRNPGRKEGITRTRPCPVAQGKSGPSSASIDLDRVDPKIQTRPLILNRVQQTPAACRTQSPRDLHIVLPATL